MQVKLCHDHGFRLTGVLSHNILIPASLFVFKLEFYRIKNSTYNVTETLEHH